MAGKLPIIAFTDFDPAGLQIAHTLTGVTHCIAPQLALVAPLELFVIGRINAIDDFDKQAKQVKYLQHADLAKWQPLVNGLLQYQVSIKQQHLLSYGIELALVAYF